MEVGEALDQGVESRLQLRGHGLFCSLELLRRDGEAALSEVRAVELQREVEEGVVALGADAVDDAAYRVGYGGIDLEASGLEPLPPVPEVEELEHLALLVDLVVRVGGRVADPGGRPAGAVRPPVPAEQDPAARGDERRGDDE